MSFVGLTLSLWFLKVALHGISSSSMKELLQFSPLPVDPVAKMLMNLIIIFMLLFCLNLSTSLVGGSGKLDHV